MSGVLALVARAVIRQPLPNIAYIPRITSCQGFTGALPRRAATGFSVSFAPEPDEPQTEALGPRKTPAKKTSGKKRSPKKADSAWGAKPLQAQEHSSDTGSKQKPGNTQAVVAPESSPITPQVQETHVLAEQETKVATSDSIGASSTEWTVDHPLKPVGPTTKGLTSEGHFRASIGWPMKEEDWESKEERRDEFLSGPDLVLDETSIEHQTPLLKLAESEADPTPEEVTEEKEPHPVLKASKKKGKKRPGSPHSPSSPPQESIPSPYPRSTSKASESLPKSKKRIEASPQRFPATKKEPWQVQKQALENKFGSEGWNPRKKLSPDTIDGIRALHEQYPDKYPTRVLAEQFKISAEAIRRILKNKWRADPEKQAERRERWTRRHDRIWDQQAAMGLRPERTKDRKLKEPGDLYGDVEIEEFQLARARKQARDLHLTDED